MPNRILTIPVFASAALLRPLLRAYSQLFLKGQAVQFGSFLLQKTCSHKSEVLRSPYGCSEMQDEGALASTGLRYLSVQGTVHTSEVRSSDKIKEGNVQVHSFALRPQNLCDSVYLAQSDHVVVKLIKHCTDR